MPKERLDKLVVERGLAETRTRAQAMIIAGQVLVDDQRVEKPGQLTNTAATIRIKGETLRYVGRGGLKLERALREFGVDPSGKTCLDVGASTGGFTDCLLQQGANRVWAVDVGHNQLAWRIRQDPRVIVMERVNARNLVKGMFPVVFDVATVDVSFISLSKILLPLKNCLAEQADCIVLVKPQFEVGKGEVGRGGVVREPAKQKQVLIEVAESATKTGLFPRGLVESPIKGAEGNREFLMHLTIKPPSEDLDFEQLIEKVSLPPKE